MTLENSVSVRWKFSFVVTIVCAAALTASATQAGFEWVPGSDGQPAASEAPAPETDISEDSMVPVPQDPVVSEDLAAPAAPAEDLTAPPEPVLQSPPEAAPPSATAQQGQIRMLTPGQPQPAAPAPAAPEEEPHMLVIPAHATQAVDGAAYAPPPAPAAPEPKVIMPGDAPASAVSNTPNASPLAINPAPVMPAQVQQAAPAQVFSEAVGFGSDVPLVMALQQVVPPDYAFSFGASVNPGARVSWTGGKPWNVVVQDISASLGLTAQIRGRVVHISGVGTATISDPAAPEGAGAQAQPVKIMDAAPAARAIIRDPGQEPAPQPVAILAPEASTQAPLEIAPPPPSESTPGDIAPAAGEPAAAAEKKPVEWLARNGDSLKETLDRWSAQAGVTLLWQASHDHIINVDIATDSSFENAVKTVFSNALDKTSRPEPVFLSDSAAQDIQVLMVRDAAAQPAPAAQEPAKSEKSEG